MSRVKARNSVRGEQLRQELQRRGILVRTGSISGLAEEAPIAYKDVTGVVEVVDPPESVENLPALNPWPSLKAE